MYATRFEFYILKKLTKPYSVYAIIRVMIKP